MAEVNLSEIMKSLTASDQAAKIIERQFKEEAANKHLQTEILKSSNAPAIAKIIVEKLNEFQKSMSDTEDIALQLVQFGEKKTIYVTSVASLGYSLVAFQGLDNNGKPCELIQHISQISILLIPVEKPSNAPHRVIGFQVQDS